MLIYSMVRKDRTICRVVVPADALANYTADITRSVTRHRLTIKMRRVPIGNGLINSSLEMNFYE
jgi:hypothetical protein